MRTTDWGIESMFSSYSLGEEGKKRRQVVLVPIEDLISNKNNFYHLSAIEGLSYSIEDLGLLSPLNVKELPNKKYEVLSGHRRLAAIQMIHESDNTKFENVEVFVEELITFNDGSDNSEEILLHGNAWSRKETDQEKFIAIEKLYTFYSKKKKDSKLKGRTRKIISLLMGLSATTIQRFRSLAVCGYQHIIDQFLSEDLTLLQALEEVKILNKKNLKEEDMIIDEEEVETVIHPTIPPRKIDTSDQKYLGYVEDLLRRKYGTKTKIRPHQIVVTYDDVRDLNRILELMGALEESVTDI